MSLQFEKYVPFVKVDSVKKEVTGIVTAEVKDKSGETCDYFGSKPYFKEWAGEFEKATEGKSCGNLRYMHTMRVVGKGIAIDFRDADKEVWMTFKVTDDQAWRDVEEGVLTGFSQGGRYIKAPDTTGVYTSSPSEVSLVDNPCLGVSHFAYIKADGQVEMRKVRSTELAKSPVATTGVVETQTPVQLLQDGFALPPFTREQLLRAVRGEDPQLTPEQIDGLNTLKALVGKASFPSLEKSESQCMCKCDSCTKCMGKSEVAPVQKAAHPEAEKAQAAVTEALDLVSKGMYDVAHFAELLNQFKWLHECATYEASNEEDESTVPGQLLASLKQLVTTFLAMAAEEAAELTEGGSGTFAYATNADVKKYSDLLTKAAEKADTMQKGAQMGETTTTKTLEQMKADRIALDKQIQDAEALETQKAAGASNGMNNTPDEFVKAINSKLDTVITGFETRFNSLMEKAESQLLPPKAAQTATGKVVNKADDGTEGVEGTENTATEAPITFRPQGEQAIKTTPEYQKALRGTQGMPVD